MPRVDLFHGTTEVDLKFVGDSQAGLKLILSAKDAFEIIFAITPEDVQKLCQWKAENWHMSNGIFQTIFVKGWAEVLSSAVYGLQTKKLSIEKKDDRHSATLFFYPKICSWSTSGVELKSVEPFSLSQSTAQDLDDYNLYLEELRDEN